jgi:hypothetical protein
MAKKKRPITKTNLTLSVDVKQHEFLKQMSFRLTAKEKQHIGISELVRRAIDEVYPMKAKQMEMFDE